ADIDLDRLVQERSRMTSFLDCATEHRERVRALRVVPFSFAPAVEPVALRRPIERFPYVPADPARRDERCYEAYSIQVSALTQRLRATGIRRVVLGVSGGLDSTHALLVAARAMDALGLGRENVLAYTMPGYATSEATRTNALALMRALGVTGRELDIRPSCDQMLRDIGHPYAAGEKVYDVTFENVQAGARTSHLFRLANHQDALVVGTGDLSELALGWCTYGVGDHMSHYNVNPSVPKTLIRHLIAWVAGSGAVDAATADVLHRILATEISPELVPAAAGSGALQSTEKTIGPYALHDFSLYYITRRGYRPAKVAFLALHAWGGEIPPTGAEPRYSAAEILRWLGVFLDRFFRTSQFKRTCVPGAPKVGSGGSLSPRGDWRAPADSEAAAWLEELEAVHEWIAASRRGEA
ncbi:MAG: NAD(+) synthase, partial [Planctomycetes bacterium]|nr:NAD(+) synthase [Planctomycetota bacterium]